MFMMRIENDPVRTENFLAYLTGYIVRNEIHFVLPL